MKQHSQSLLPPIWSVPFRPTGDLKPVPIRFLFQDPTALSVAVAGTFNDWDSKKHEARKRLTRALENGEEIYHRARDRAIAGAKVTDAAIHQHPYQAIAVGVGVGALVGYLIARKADCNGG